MSFPIRRKGVVKRTVKKGNVLTKVSRPHCPWPTLQQCETPLHSRSLVEFPAAPTEPRQYPAGKIICAVPWSKHGIWDMAAHPIEECQPSSVQYTIVNPIKTGENHPQYGYLPVSSNVAIGAKSPN